MLQLNATLKWKTTSEIGKSINPFSGVQPSFAIGNDLIMSQVFRADGSAEMCLGKEYEVIIKLPYGDIYREQISPEMQFNLNVGSRVVAVGTIRDID